MPNFPPNDTPSTPASDYATDPWTDANGQQWTSDEVAPNVYRWHPYTATGGSSVWGGITGTLADQTDLGTALGLKAPLASPTFTGTVTIPSGASISGYLTTATAASTYQPIGSYAPASGIAASAISGTAVTLSGIQTITGDKTFTGSVEITTLSGNTIDSLTFKGYDVATANNWTLTTPDSRLGANRAYTTPNASGVLALTSETDGKANLATGAAGILPKSNGGTGVSALGATGEALMQAGNVAAAKSALEITTLKLASTQALTTASFVSVTGMTYSLSANSIYRLEGQIYYTSDTGGLLAGWVSTGFESGAAGNSRGFCVGPDGTVKSVFISASVENGLLVYQESAARTGRPVTYTIFFATGTSATTITLRAQKNAGTGGDTSILVPTWARLEKIA